MDPVDGDVGPQQEPGVLSRHDGTRLPTCVLTGPGSPGREYLYLLRPPFCYIIIILFGRLTTKDTQWL